jgi:hypothetical protein
MIKRQRLSKASAFYEQLGKVARTKRDNLKEEMRKLYEPERFDISAHVEELKKVMGAPEHMLYKGDLEASLKYAQRQAEENGCRDMYRMTAAVYLGVGYDDVTQEQRDKIKKYCFGLVYRPMGTMTGRYHHE